MKLVASLGPAGNHSLEPGPQLRCPGDGGIGALSSLVFMAQSNTSKRQFRLLRFVSQRGRENICNDKFAKEMPLRKGQPFVYFVSVCVCVYIGRAHV